MKNKNIITVFLFTTILVSCAPTVIVASPTETNVPTLIPALTFTPVPPTLTPTPIPPIETLPITQQSISQFANAMQKVGIDIVAEQILQQGLQIKNKISVNGEKYEIAIIHLDSDPKKQGEAIEGDYGIMMRMDGGEWERLTYKNGGAVNGLLMGTDFGDFGNTQDRTTISDDVTKEATRLANEHFGSFIVLQDPFHYSTLGNDFRKNLNFNTAKKELSWIVDKDALVRGQSIIYGFEIQFNPWLEEFFASNPSKQDVLDFVKAHVTKIISAYKDKGEIKEWAVVNEVGQEDLFYDVAGFDYVTTAFNAARSTDGSAYLIYNFNQNNLKPNEFTQNAMKTLMKDNLVDGLGLQFHLDGSTNITEAGIKKLLKSYIDIGISPENISISEFDVNMHNVGGTDEVRRKRKGEVVAMVLKACKEIGIKKFVFWEATYPDKYNWLEQNNQDSYWGSPRNDASLFTLNDKEEIVPDFAYYAGLKALFEDKSK